MGKKSKVPSVKCSARKTNGEPCPNWAIRGGTVCNSHGVNKKTRAKAAVVANFFQWGLGDSNIDPGEALLRLVSQSAARANFYAQLLEDAYDAAQRIQNNPDSALAHLKVDSEVRSALADQAREDLDRIFNQGGVAALVGITWGAAKDIGTYQTGEAIRGLAKLESEERDRCAGFATKAIAAGLAERQVRMAERQEDMGVELLRTALRLMGKSEAEAKPILFEALNEVHKKAITTTAATRRVLVQP